MKTDLRPAMSSAFADLVAQTVRIPNPQRALRGVPGEKALADFLCKWLTARGIQCECDLHWGMHGVLTGPDGPGAPGVLLAAHMYPRKGSNPGLTASMHVADPMFEPLRGQGQRPLGRA